MVGSPDEHLSNTLPPKITLLALGVFQFGLLLAIESPMRRLLSGVRIWAATVLINSMIMTLYLWHITIMVTLVALAYSPTDSDCERSPEHWNGGYRGHSGLRSCMRPCSQSLCC